MSQLFTYPKFKAVDGNGVPINGGTVYFYEVGTTTPKAVYSDYTLGTALGTSVTLDSHGEASIYFSGKYKAVLKDADGATVWTMDNLQGQGASILSFHQLSEYADLATALSTIESTETMLVIDEDVALAENTTVPSTLTLWVLPGSKITTTGYTLIINGPFSAGPYQVFTGSGTVTGLSYVDPRWFGFSISATGANNQTYLTSAIASLSSGGTFELPSGSYAMDGQWTISKACTVNGYSCKLDWPSDTSASRGLLITASNVELYGLELAGPQYASGVGTQQGINAYGADKDNYLSGVKIRNCILSNWGYDGIKGEFVQNLDISSNVITGCYYSGIRLFSCQSGTVAHNEISTISGTPLAYGVTLSRTTSDSLVTNPRTKDIKIIGNTIKDVTNWVGIDTHAGQKLEIHGNTVTGCKRGISVGSADNASGAYTWGPLEVHVVGNTVDSSGLTAGTATYGIDFTGAIHSGTVNEYATGSIVGNTIIDYGDEDTATSNALYLHTTKGLTVTGNNIIRPSPNGILLYYNNLDFTISGNSIIDAWSATNPAVAIYSYDVSNRGFIGGNTFGVSGYTGGVKTHELTTVNEGLGIRVTDKTGVGLKIGQNYSKASRYILDTGQKAMLGNSTAVVQNTTDETDLCSQVIPQGSIGQGERIRVVGSGTKTNLNGNKTIKFYFGTSSVTFNAAANDTHDWKVEADIWIYAYNQQRITLTGFNGTAIVQDHFDATEDLSAGDVTMKLTGQCADNGDIITQRLWLVNRY